MCEALQSIVSGLFYCEDVIATNARGEQTSDNGRLLLNRIMISHNYRPGTLLSGEDTQPRPMWVLHKI